MSKMLKQKTVLSFFQRVCERESPTSMGSENDGEIQNEDIKNSKSATSNQQFSASDVNIRDPACGVKSSKISDGPYQPKCDFKVEKVQGKSRSFKESWYADFPWLEYSIVKDAAFCYSCRLFCQQKSGRGEENFTTQGVSNWKKALEKFRKHEASEMHLKSMQFWTENKSCGNTISDKLSIAHSKQVQENRIYLKFVIENILFLGKQCLALRGHDESLTSVNKGNFLELLEIRGKDKGKEITESMNSRIHSYKSGQIQNEIINIIKIKIIENIVEEINTCSAYSIICDETTDTATKEQLSICVRYPHKTSNGFIVKERFLGFIDVIDMTGANLHSVIKDYLGQIGLNLNNMRGQAYDGAANMSGKFNGVAAKFKEEEPRALYTHCHAHLLDLAVMRFCEEVKALRNALNVVNSLYNIINASAKRFSIFENICKKSEDSIFKKLCSLSKTRWTVRHRALSAVIDKLPEIIETLDVVSNDSSNVKVASEADGLSKLISNFEFIFSLKFLHRILSLTDILSKELQSETLDILSLFPKVEAVIHCLSSERNEEIFKRIWDETEELCSKINSIGYDIEKPNLQRRRKVPKKLDHGNSNTAFFSTSPEEEYKINIYYRGLDAILTNLRQRFSENDYSKIKIISQLLLNWKEPLNEKAAIDIHAFYKMSSSVIPQLRFYQNFASIHFNPNATLMDIANSIIEHNLSTNAPCVFELFEIAMSWPITTASAERSFSTLRRLKNYLRSTMGEDRLSGLALMAIEQEVTSKFMQPEGLDILVEKFASSAARRMKLY